MKIKILYTIPSLSACDGIASFTMNYYRRINHDKFTIDFLLNTPGGEYVKEVEEYGDRIFVIDEPELEHFKKFLSDINEFFLHNHDYDIIHCHVPNMAAFYLHYAKKYAIKTRILHSHVTRSSDIPMKRLRNDMLAPFAVSNATNRVACTKAAGRYLFGEKSFTIINNAIEINKFMYSMETRNRIRRELGVEDKLVIGFVGRFCNQKNPLFIIDIFKKIYQKRRNAQLLLIGEGPLEKEMRKLVSEKNLDEVVIFAGKQSEVAPFYQAMDVFLLPSRYEGLGIVLIEAQISGLPTITSTVVPEETRVTSSIKYISLNKESRVWAREILRSVSTGQRSSHRIEAEKCGFDISRRVVALEHYYLGCFRRQHGS